MLPVLERAHYVVPDAGLTLVRSYVMRCDEAGQEPDGEIFGRMEAVLVSAGVIVDEEDQA